jgi:ABC-type taurine transport system ATPase subunit
MDLDHCIDTHVGGVESAYGVLIQGGLSSGERRRLQVAAALISKPETICLDEPTTGLDATNALHLMQRIKMLCSETHMTAVASLHQCRREIMVELDMVRPARVSRLIRGQGSGSRCRGGQGHRRRSSELVLLSICSPSTFPLGLRIL